MTEIERIVQQYDRALRGGGWHGKSVWEILAGVTSEIAFAKPAGSTHNIWQLVKHITFWESEVFRRIKRLPKQSEEELNFPKTTEETPENWANALEELGRSNTKFRKMLTELNENVLESPLSSPAFTYYVEVHGVIQHHLYHAGQIALLHRLLTSK